MSLEIAHDRVAARERARATGLFALAHREAWRMVTSPAVALVALYLFLVGGVATVTEFAELTRAMYAEVLEVLLFMLVALSFFPAVHLTATSARRAGAEAQLAAAPTDPVRRDMSLCLGVLFGPGGVALVLALLAAWVAGGVVQGPLDEPQIDPWTATDVLQWPALATGAGILAVVVARWLRFPGSLLIGFFGMILATGWAVGQGGTTIPWLAWFRIKASNSASDTVLVPSTSLAWHTAYLFSWSLVGVCAVGLRQSEHKRTWLLALCLAAALVAATGLLQLPLTPVRLYQ